MRCFSVAFVSVCCYIFLIRIWGGDGGGREWVYGIELFGGFLDFWLVLRRL